MFIWDEKCQKVFETAKHADSSAYSYSTNLSGIIHLVYSDASNNGWRCVLMEEGKAISYASWKLKLHELNHPNHDHLTCFYSVFFNNLATIFVWGEMSHIH